MFKKLQLFKIESLLFGHYQNRIISVTPKAADELKGSENRSVAMGTQLPHALVSYYYLSNYQIT